MDTGRRIGPYEVVAPLGEGGMGSVYHARRTDDVFHKDVAIKVVKRGLDSEAILRRFQRERRILARLEHPSIARVLDGGTTDEGLPYLVMEHVDGRSLPEYANEHALDLRARLQLFAQVCEAVQYAHDRQVVHRDLKPGNILVDGTGRPRLLDFGIAMVVGAADEGITQTTGMGLMTPRYASPEQVKGEPVTPASDQYSLGVLLYELVSGCPAHRIATDSPAAILKAVCEDEVPPPSAAAESARRGGRTVPIEPGALSGDLDRVVMTAVAKDPAERYSSVQALADDIRRLLASQPIAATAGTTGHRMRKLARRHPVLIAASLAAIVALGAVGFLARGARRSATLPRGGKLMLAVLPLENLTGNEERSYFVDGLHEEIISRLGRLQPARLGVIARTSVLQYKGTSKSIADIGRELGAGYILEGSVREAGPTVRVTAQLIQASDQTHLWVETYDRQLNDLFTVQSEIGAHVADSLSVAVLPDAVAALESNEQLSPDANAAYLRARYIWHRRVVNYPTNVQLAADSFQAVTAAAPAYAPGYAGLSEALLYLSRNLHQPPNQPLVKQARQAIEKALTLDPRLASAQATLALMKFRIDWDWDGAEEGFRRALTQDPNNAEIHLQLAILLAYGGRHDEAQREIQLALELDPQSPTTHDSAYYIHLSARRWDKARQMTERLAQLVPDDSTAAYCRSLLLALQNNCPAAVDQLRRIENRGREMVESEMSFFQGYVLARCGRRQDAMRYVKRLDEDPNTLSLTMAEVWAGLDDRANTLRWVEEGYRRHEWFLPYVAVDPILAPFRDDPRFQAVLRQMNYPFAGAAAPK